MSDSPATPPVLRALLVDDERLSRKLLRQLLAVHPEIEIIGEADGVEPAARLAAELRPDVIFLDIQMPPANGFALLPMLDPLPKIVFVTAFDAFAVKAFEENALDYLLKPVHPERLEKTVRRLVETVPENGALPPLESAGDGKPSRRLEIHDPVTLRDKRQLRIISAGAIAAIEAEAAYSRVILSGQSPMLVLGSIADWEERLPSPPFARLERSLIVNLRQVRSVDALSRDETSLRLEGVEEPLRLGRTAAARLRKLFGEQGHYPS